MLWEDEIIVSLSSFFLVTKHRYKGREKIRMTNTKDTHHLRQIGSNDKTIPFCVVMFDAYNILM